MVHLSALCTMKDLTPVILINSFTCNLVALIRLADDEHANGISS